MDVTTVIFTGLNLLLGIINTIKIFKVKSSCSKCCDVEADIETDNTRIMSKNEFLNKV